MVCNSCREAGRIYATDPVMARRYHVKCKGATWCDCHHVILPPAEEPVKEVIE